MQNRQTKKLDLCKILKVKKHDSDNKDEKTIEYLLYRSVFDQREGYSLEIVISNGEDIDRAFAEDFVSDRDKAEEFLYTLFREEVEPCHLTDILYDTLPL